MPTNGVEKNGQHQGEAKRMISGSTAAFQILIWTNLSSVGDHIYILVSFPPPNCEPPFFLASERKKLQ